MSNLIPPHLSVRNARQLSVGLPQFRKRLKKVLQCFRHRPHRTASNLKNHFVRNVKLGFRRKVTFSTFLRRIVKCCFEKCKRRFVARKLLPSSFVSNFSTSRNVLERRDEYKREREREINRCVLRDYFFRYDK